MSREELEKKAFEVLSLSMEYNGEDAEIWEQIKAATDRDLWNYVKLAKYLSICGVDSEEDEIFCE